METGNQTKGSFIDLRAAVIPKRSVIKFSSCGTFNHLNVLSPWPVLEASFGKKFARDFEFN